MLTNSQKIEITEEILKSKLFVKAPTSSGLLRYLVEAEAEGRFLKEGIIDMEYFGSKSELYKNNPRVRVNVYNLRKKLLAYYENEGSQATWKISIDKGQYSVRFEKQHRSKSKIEQINLTQVTGYILFGMLLLYLIVDKLPAKKPELWAGLMNNSVPTTLYLGDAFGLMGKTATGSVGWNRDYNINNLEEFYEYLDKHPALKDHLKPANYSYLTLQAAESTHMLTQLYDQYQSKFDIRFSSSTSFNEIKSGNAIYAGLLKNNNKFVSTFNDANPYFKINNRTLHFSHHNSLADTTFNLETSGLEWEWLVVSRIPGPGGTEQFLFFSDHDIGVVAAMEIFTDKKAISVFEKKYLQNHTYFTALYKAYGKERINMRLEEIRVVPF